MKQFLSIIALVLMASLVHAAPAYSVTVANTPTLIAPDRTIVNAAAFAADTALAQGSYIKTSTGKIYVTIVAGTTGSSAPTHNGSAANGTATLYRVETGPRRSLVISNDSTDTFYIAVGDKIVSTSTGTRLNASGGTYILDAAIQDAVYAIGTGKLTVQEL